VAVVVINNPQDPITDVLTHPQHLAGLAEGKNQCHSYNNWTYAHRTPDRIVCN
jgi:hypothetical protein